MANNQLLDENKLKNNFEPEEPTKGKSSRTFLYIAACTANLFAFICGIAFGWSSPILPKLRENIESTLEASITPEDASWIGSLLPMGAAIGPFAAGFCADRFGRKKTILLSAMPMLIAFFTFAYANTVNFYFVGRFLCGLSVGGVFTVLPVYIAEIAEDEVRSSLGSFMQLFIVVGLTVSYAVGPYIPMANYNLLTCLVIILSISAFFLYIPETPHFLIAQNELKLAEESLMKLRSKSRDEIMPELAIIKESVQSASEKNGGFADIFKSKVVKKALVLTLLLMVYQQFCGINVVLFYTETIFAATGSSIPPDVSTIIIGFVQIGASSVTPLVVDKYGKRFLLISSALMMCIAEVTLGLYFYLKEIGNDVSGIFWLPICCLVVYMIFYSIGMGPLPWAVMGELFPPEVKSAAATAIAASCWLMGFLLTKFFGDVSQLIGIGGSFWIFAAFCAVAVVQIYKCLPETSGKSLKEIQEILAKG